jgi:DNA-binding CsgD family transcriptional regulator
VIGADERLVEREGELDSAAAALDLILEGGGRTLLVEGPAGIGKSALLVAIRELAAERGFRELTARGSELEIDFPFGVVRQLFEATVIDEGTRAVALADAAAPADAVFGAPGADSAGGDDVSFSALHGLYWMTVNLSADAPLLLFVDDLHWCDRPSLRFLAYLSHRLEGAPIGVVAGLRSTDRGVDPALVADIAGATSTIAISPAPLSIEAVGAVVEARLDHAADDRFRSDCQRATGGNPLLLHQLLSALAIEGANPTAREAGVISQVGPRAVSRTVLMRLSRLPPEATEVARAMAILGDGADLEAIASLSGHERAGVARITGSLARAEIFRPGAPLGFVHPLVRDAIYEDVPPGERQLQHARAAKLMVDAGAQAEKVAAQLLQAPAIGEDWVPPILEEAAHAAVSKGAQESASTYLARLLAEPVGDTQRAAILFELGLAEVRSNGPAASEHLRLAYESLDDVSMRGLAAYSLARTLLFMGEVEEARRFASEAARAMPPGHEDVVAMITAMELMALYFGADVPDAADRFRELRAIPAGSAGGESMLAAASALDWMLRGGSAQEVSELASAALSSEALLELDPGLLWVSANLVFVCAERPEALNIWESAMDRSHRSGSMFGMLAVHLWRGFTQLRHGELAEAEASVEAAIEHLGLWGVAVLDYSIAFLARTLIEMGRIDEAEAALYGVDAPESHSEGAQLWRESQVELMLARGADQQAFDAARSNAEIGDWRKNPTLIPWGSLQARALDRLGRAEEALEVLDLELAQAEAWGAPGTVGRTLRVRGEIRRADGIDDLRRAIELLENSPMRLELAKALAALGSTLRRDRKPSEAREPLRRAFELAELCGAKGLAAEIRTELHATGVRPRSSSLKGPGSLTASERRVADLAASGQTNKQIAQTLYVTPKTVEVHLSNAYRKLEIGSRGELAAALGEE